MGLLFLVLCSSYRQQRDSGASERPEQAQRDLCRFRKQRCVGCMACTRVFQGTVAVRTTIRYGTICAAISKNLHSAATMQSLGSARHRTSRAPGRSHIARPEYVMR